MGIRRRSLLIGGSGAAAILALAAGSARAAGTPADPILMHFNENPYGMSPKAKAALLASDEREHHRYVTEAQVIALIETIAAYEAVPTGKVVIGSGSTELLNAVALAYGAGGREIVTSELAYPQLPDYARLVGARLITAPMAAGFQTDLERLEAAVTDKTALVYLCNPNNPTGAAADPDALRGFVRRVSERTAVCIDECYVDQSDAPIRGSMVDLVREGRPVIVTRTFSKTHGMAGLRLGYALAPEAVVTRLEQYRMTILATAIMAAGQASLLDTEYQAWSRKKLIEGRLRLQAMLDDLGLPYVRSNANFVFFDTRRPKGQTGDRLLEKGVRIRRTIAGPDSYARVSVGTEAEIARFGEIMRDIYRT